MILLALAAIYLFWVKAAVVGCILVVLNVLFIERILHSEYIFNDDTLTLYRGRFRRARVIRLADIKSCIPVTTSFGMEHYLLLELAGRKFAAVDPAQQDRFVKHLEARIDALSDTADTEENTPTKN